MKPPTDHITDYLQPSETSSPSLKSPLELLANACNKLETDMMGAASGPGLAARKLSSPPSSLASVSSHIPQLRLPPSRPEPLSLVTRPSPSPSVSSSGLSLTTPLPSSLPSTQSQSPIGSSKSPERSDKPGSVSSNNSVNTSEPLSLVNKPKSVEGPENLSKKSESPEQKSRTPPLRPEIGSIRVRPAEALSPAAQPPAKKPRESPSPRLTTHRPPSSSPLPQSTPSPRPPPTSLPTLPPGFPPSLATSLAMTSPYSPYTSPYLSALGANLGGVPGGSPAPCTDPMCRDPACPTYQLRAAQAAQLMALTGYPGYPGYPPLPGMPGLPSSLLPPSFPGAGAALPGMLPPSLLAPPPVPSSIPSPSVSAASLPTVGGASQFMCSWMQGRDFCGRRFNSSEELMSHLRTHTANMGDSPTPPAGTAPTPAGPSAPAPPTSALALLQAQAAQLRSQASPAASSVSPPSLTSPDPRLHPYLRPGLTPPAPSHPALNPMLASLYGSPRQLPGLS